MVKPRVHYHLPGLFEFYELYRVFLPLLREHREWFYDWCDVGSIYGASSPRPAARIRDIRTADLQQFPFAGGTSVGRKVQ